MKMKLNFRKHNAYNAKLNEDGMQALDGAYNQLAELSAELEALKESQADKQAEIDEYTEDIASLNLIKTGKETDIESVMIASIFLTVELIHCRLK